MPFLREIKTGKISKLRPDRSQKENAHRTRKLMVVFIQQAARIPKENLDHLGQVDIPLSAWTAQLSGKRFLNNTPGVVSMGIWECTKGSWKRTIREEEFAHFVQGSARFTPENGEPINIRAGDTIWFPANSGGVWDVTEDLRKVYVVIARPSFIKSLRMWAARHVSSIRPLMRPEGDRPADNSARRGSNDMPHHISPRGACDALVLANKQLVK
jgi:uncharacterized cupin superfamily protein